MQMTRSTRVLALLSVLLLVLGLGVARCEVEPRTAAVRVAAATGPAVPVVRDPMPRQSTAITTTTQPAPPPTTRPTSPVHTTTHHSTSTKHSNSSGHWHPGGPCPSPSQCPQLRACENGGSYSHGTSPGYDGAYQFADKSQWGMSSSQQDAQADAMYADRGADPWPTCGRYLR